MGLETRMAAMQWAPSYQRAVWLVAALLVGAVVPFTIFVIMPTNHKLLTPGGDLSGAETRELLVSWGRLHAVPTVLSVAGTVIYIWM